MNTIIMKTSSFSLGLSLILSVTIADMHYSLYCCLLNHQFHVYTQDIVFTFHFLECNNIHYHPPDINRKKPLDTS